MELEDLYFVEFWLGMLVSTWEFEQYLGIGTINTVQPLYKNIIGNHLYILIREVFLYKGNSLFWLKKL